MQKRSRANIETGVPSGWPKDLALPTEKEAREAVSEGEKKIREMVQALKGRVEGISQETLNISINI